MEVDWAVREMSGAVLADGRQVKSVIRICADLEEHRELSLTAALGDGLRQAAHRIFEHEGTSVDGLLAGHYAATAARCGALPRVLIAQDTCDFVYQQGQITGLAPFNQFKSVRGLKGHGALALTTAGTPLGLLHLTLRGDAGKADDAGEADEAGTAGAVNPAPPPDPDPWVPLAERESYKWHEGLQATAARLPPETEGILIQDREGDIFALLGADRPAHLHLLVRASYNRSLTYQAWSEAPETLVPGTAAALPTPAGRGSAPLPGRSGGPDPEASAAPLLRTERGSLFTVAAAAPSWGTLHVQVPRRAATSQHPARAARSADLEVRVTEVRLQRPRREAQTPDVPREVSVWVVQAAERTEGIPPEERLCWVLLSTLPVADLATACTLVGYYVLRWTIERLHYTLKSGLRVERLQIDDARSLSHALALYYVVACRLLQLTYLARHAPERPAVEVLDATELVVLAAATRLPVATVAQAVAALARLGGHTRYRKALPPGVKVLWQGLQRLHGLAEGWRLAHQVTQ